MTDDERKHAFDVLYASLKNYHDGTIEGTFKVVGFGLLILGWLVTSKEVRAFLRVASTIHTMGIVALVISGIVYSVISYRVFKLSHKVSATLEALDYHPRAVYGDRIMRASRVAIFAGCVWLIIGVLVFFLVELPRLPAAT